MEWIVRCKRGQDRVDLERKGGMAACAAAEARQRTKEPTRATDVVQVKQVGTWMARVRKIASPPLRDGNRLLDRLLVS